MSDYRGFTEFELVHPDHLKYKVPVTLSSSPSTTTYVRAIPHTWHTHSAVHSGCTVGSEITSQRPAYKSPMYWFDETESEHVMKYLRTTEATSSTYIMACVYISMVCTSEYNIICMQLYICVCKCIIQWTPLIKNPLTKNFCL